MATGPVYAGSCTGPVRIALPPIDEHAVLAMARPATTASASLRTIHGGITGRRMTMIMGARGDSCNPGVSEPW
jgi:hypothetical protein